MGYNVPQWDFLHKCLNKYFDIFDGKLMLELGNQRIKKELLKRDKIKNNVAKKFFETMGFKHTSFDYNGLDGSVATDLSKEISSKYFNKYDVITNSGTTEHVEPYDKQYECFKNIHMCCKKGGIFIHIIPQFGGFKNHCQIYYTEDFFKDLASSNNYEILDLEVFKKANGCNLMVCLKKNEDNEFCNDRDTILKNIKRVPYTEKFLKKIKAKKSYRYTINK
jgi:hypothetical protein